MYIALKWPNNNGTTDLQHKICVFLFRHTINHERTHNNVQSSLLKGTPMRRTPIVGPCLSLLPLFRWLSKRWTFLSFFLSDGRVDCIFFYCRWSKWWNCKWNLKYLLVCGEVDFSITEIGSEREKVNETSCKREIEGFYVVFTEDLLVFKSGAPNDCFL